MSDEEHDYATVVDASAYGGSNIPDYPVVEQFGRYEILGRLASGGMAEVFLARDRLGMSMVHHLVIKRVLPHMADNDDFIRMFLDEGNIANRLYHPNICHVYESGDVAGAYYMAMEWVNGPPLRRLIRRGNDRGRVPLPIAVKIVSHIAEALHYAHEAKGEGGIPLNIVHRDVSPHNVMLSWSGAVKLLDFGIAKAATQGARTEAGVVKGKYAYISPEQCRSQQIDRRADVFALGICLYEVVTGRPLYHCDTVLNTMQAIVYDDVPSLSQAAGEAPEELDHILQRSLQKDPADRFQTAREMQKALERFLASRGEVVDALRISDYLSMIFEEDEKAPLAVAARQTGSSNQLTPSASGSFGPFGKAPRVEPATVDASLAVKPASQKQSAIETVRMTALDEEGLDRGTLRAATWIWLVVGMATAAGAMAATVHFLL